MMYLFTTPSCPYCPQAKQLLQNHAFRFESIDASKPVGFAMAKQFQVAKVPSLLVTDTEGQKTGVYFGFEEIASYVNGL